MNATAKHPCGDFKSPGSYGLFELLEGVISDWAFLGSQMAGLPAAGPAQLGLEYSVRLKGECECLLVLRSLPEFGALLAEASTGDPGAREQGADAFKELCNLVANHYWIELCEGEKAEFGAWVPEPSLPDSWPGREADSACVLFCEKFPLEARLWIGLDPS